jgi:hypothetical protein
MNKLAQVFILAGSSLLISSQSFAQSSFEGAFGQIGIGYANVSPSLSTTPLTVPGIGSLNPSASPSSQGSFTGTVTIGYYASLNKDYLLGIGAEYSPFALSSGSVSGSANTPKGTVNGSGTYQVNNSYNIFLSPALSIQKDSLLYAKVGYTGLSSTSNGPRGSGTQNYTGYSLGLGYKQIIRGGLYGFGEANYFSYGNQTNTKSGVVTGTAYSYSISNTSSLNSYNLLVGLGYKY